jgi:bifunctional non-homologous end joining protein LigD
VYAGKVGTGFDQDLIRRLGEKLARLETPVSPFAVDGLPRRGVHWVKPKLIAQNRIHRVDGGGKLRHPRFLGLRNDKRPEDIVLEG